MNPVDIWPLSITSTLYSAAQQRRTQISPTTLMLSKRLGSILMFLDLNISRSPIYSLKSSSHPPSHHCGIFSLKVILRIRQILFKLTQSGRWILKSLLESSCLSIIITRLVDLVPSKMELPMSPLTTHDIPIQITKSHFSTVFPHVLQPHNKKTVR